MEPGDSESDPGEHTQLSARARQVQFDAPEDAPDMDRRSRSRSFFSDNDPSSPRSPAYIAHNYDDGEMMGMAEDNNMSVSDLLVGTSAGFFGPKFLLFGCILGIMGFLLVVTVMVSCQIQNEKGTAYVRECSDYRPMPASVSELVHRWDSVCGRIFFGLEFLAGLSIYLSAYGFCFKNSACDCYVDFSFTLCGYHFPMSCMNRMVHELDLRWCDVRMFVPPVGYMLVCLVPTVPIYQTQGVHEGIMIGCHCFAAFMMFLGIMACELHFWNHHVDYADPDHEFEAKTLAELSSTTPHAHMAIQPRAARSVERVALTYQNRMPGDYIYYIGYKELFCRRVFNLGNAVFFFMFLAFQVLLDVQSCTPAKFVLADKGASCPNTSRGCEEVSSLEECEAANAMLVDHAWSKKGSAATIWDVPINFPPCEVGVEGANAGQGHCTHLEPARPGQKPPAFARDMPFGCFIRADPVKTAGDSGAFFYWNKDKYNDVPPSKPRDDDPRQVCKCGKHIIDKTSVDPDAGRTVLEQLFEGKTKMGDSISDLISFLRDHRDKKHQLFQFNGGDETETDGLPTPVPDFRPRIKPPRASGDLEPRPNDRVTRIKPPRPSWALAADGLEDAPLERQAVVRAARSKSQTGSLVRKREGKGLVREAAGRTSDLSATEYGNTIVKMMMPETRLSRREGATAEVDPRATFPNSERAQMHDRTVTAGSPADNWRQNDVPDSVQAQMLQLIASTDEWPGVRCGACELYTIGSFFSEVLAGLCSVWLHLIIWFFCEERFLHTKDRRYTAAHAYKTNHRSWRRAQKLAAQLEEEYTPTERSEVSEDGGQDRADPAAYDHETEAESSEGGTRYSRFA